jgi:hypothetical protein
MLWTACIWSCCRCTIVNVLLGSVCRRTLCLRCIIAINISGMSTGGSMLLVTFQVYGFHLQPDCLRFGRFSLGSCQGSPTPDCYLSLLVNIVLNGTLCRR